MKKATILTSIMMLLMAAVPARAQRENPPPPQPLDKVEFPAYLERTLANGLRVFALQHDEQPVVSVELVIGAGGMNDPADLPGLATFTTSLLDSGTATRSAQQIAEALDNAGGNLTTRAAREAIIVSGSTLKDSTSLVFELMKDVVTNPVFAPEEIERLRQQMGSGMMANLQDPDFIADTALPVALYGTHPYAHPADGTPDSLGRIERADIVAFHDTYFAPNTSALAIAGNVTPEEAFALAEEWFGDWARRDVPVLDVSELDPFEGPKIVVIDNPDSVQTEIRVGQVTVARKDPDYFPVLIASYVLGGASGRLMRSLRVERGLTYGAYETIVPRKGPGSLYALTETRTEMTAEAVGLILDEISRIREERVPEDELEAVKAFVIGSFPLTIETPNDLAGRLANIAVFDLGDDYLTTYRDKLAAITSDDVARVARERITTEDIVILLVGRAEEFLEEIEQLGPVQLIPLRALDLGSPTLTPAP